MFENDFDAIISLYTVPINSKPSKNELTCNLYKFCRYQWWYTFDNLIFIFKNTEIVELYY